MALRKLAAGAAMLAFATPGLALDVGNSGTATTMFYISIPLGSGLAHKREQWSAGLQIQGKADQALRIDSTMLNVFSLNDIDAKWWFAGAVAVGAAAAIGAKDKKTTSDLQQQQTQQQQAQQASTGQPSGGNAGPGVCPRPVNDPCKR